MPDTKTVVFTVAVTEVRKRTVEVPVEVPEGDLTNPAWRREAAEKAKALPATEWNAPTMSAEVLYSHRSTPVQELRDEEADREELVAAELFGTDEEEA